MRLVELAYLQATPEEEKKRAIAFVEALGKTPVPVLGSSDFVGHCASAEAERSLLQVSKNLTSNTAIADRLPKNSAMFHHRQG